MTEPKPTTIRPCLVCGKECAHTDRNSDGTYAHRDCLYTVSTRPFRG
jgi:hypothetical protein